MATLKDLSKYTGFSIATISRILNHDPSMSASEETRQKVLQAAEELNYAATKSRKGRSLKTSLHVGVALMGPDPDRREAYEKLWRAAIDQTCREMKVGWFEIRFDRIEELEGDERQCNGILAIGRFQPAQVNWLYHRCEHVVFIDDAPDDLHADSVVVNCWAGMAQAVEYLMSFGHERIGYVGPKRTVYSSARRGFTDALHALYADAMCAYGLEHAIWTLAAPAERHETKHVLGEYMKRNQSLPTALLAATEENAVGVLGALREKGYAVPRDVSVVAFSDIVQSRLESLSLTAVQPQVEAMCKAALRLVGEYMQGHTFSVARTSPKKALIPPLLMRRQSVGASRDPELIGGKEW